MYAPATRLPVTLYRDYVIELLSNRVHVRTAHGYFVLEADSLDKAEATIDQWLDGGEDDTDLKE